MSNISFCHNVINSIQQLYNHFIDIFHINVQKSSAADCCMCESVNLKTYMLLLNLHAFKATEKNNVLPRNQQYDFNAKLKTVWEREYLLIMNHFFF